jgi:hypothetical protein
MPREAIAIAPTGRASRMSVRPAETLSAGRVISFAELEAWQVLVFDGGASARNVDLPAEAASAGAFLWIVNIGATAALTVRNPATTTIVSVLLGTGALVACDGTAWRKVLP